MMIGLFHITLYILAAIFIFGLPLRGSLLLLYGSSIFYLASVVGIGLFISALSMTQQQAILGAFLFMVPAMLLSGFATPIENMPELAAAGDVGQSAALLPDHREGRVPEGHQPWRGGEPDMPLCLIAVGTLSAAAWLFRRRLE